MKRILLSMLTGILFPILYMILIGTFHALLFSKYDLISMEIYGQSTMGLFLTPVALPVWMYDFIKFHNHFGYGIYLDTLWFRLLLMLGFNFSLYAILSYFLFSYFGWFSSIKALTYQQPPKPPEF